jgi:hypothetical protein
MRYLLLLAAASAAPALRQIRPGQCRGHHLQRQSRARAGHAAARHPGAPLAAGISRRLRADPPGNGDLSGDGIEIVEQNFDFDLLSPQALMENAVGQTITLVRVNPATGAETRERATVLAVNETA